MSKDFPCDYEIHNASGLQHLTSSVILVGYYRTSGWTAFKEGPWSDDIHDLPTEEELHEEMIRRGWCTKAEILKAKMFPQREREKLPSGRWGASPFMHMCVNYDQRRSNMTDVTNYLDSTLEKMVQNKGRDGILARIVQEQNHEHPANRIVLARHFLNQARNEAKLKEKETGVPQDVGEKPEQLLSFCQHVMNEVCWAARRQYRQLIEQAEEERENGIDFTQDTAEQLNCEYVEARHVEDLVDETYGVMIRVHSYLAGKMNYLTDIRDLVMFQTMETDEEGTWIVTGEAETFSEAMDLMDEQILRIQELTLANELDEANELDFSAAAA